MPREFAARRPRLARLVARLLSLAPEARPLCGAVLSELLEMRAEGKIDARAGPMRAQRVPATAQARARSSSADSDSTSEQMLSPLLPPTAAERVSPLLSPAATPLLPPAKLSRLRTPLAPQLVERADSEQPFFLSPAAAPPPPLPGGSAAAGEERVDVARLRVEMQILADELRRSELPA